MAANQPGQVPIPLMRYVSVRKKYQAQQAAQQAAGGPSSSAYSQGNPPDQMQELPSQASNEATPGESASRDQHHDDARAQLEGDHDSVNSSQLARQAFLAQHPTDWQTQDPIPLHDDNIEDIQECHQPQQAVDLHPSDRQQLAQIQRDRAIQEANREVQLRTFRDRYNESLRSSKREAYARYCQDVQEMIGEDVDVPEPVVDVDPSTSASAPPPALADASEQTPTRALALRFDRPDMGTKSGHRLVRVTCGSETVDVPVLSYTSVRDVIKAAATSLSVDVNTHTDVLMEEFRKVGLQRPCRRYERIREIINAWDYDQQNPLTIVPSPNGKRNPDLEAGSVLVQTPLQFGCQMEYSQRPGKWSTRWVTLRSGGQLVVSKRKDSTDAKQYHAGDLSEYEIYTPTLKAMVNKIKPPKTYCFAVKSTQKSLCFADNNLDSYMHFFCTNDKATAGKFWSNVWKWRSWYMVNIMRVGMNTRNKAAQRYARASGVTLPSEYLRQTSNISLCSEVPLEESYGKTGIDAAASYSEHRAGWSKPTWPLSKGSRKSQRKSPHPLLSMFSRDDPADSYAKRLEEADAFELRREAGIESSDDEGKSRKRPVQYADSHRPADDSWLPTRNAHGNIVDPRQNSGTRNTVNTPHGWVPATFAPGSLVGRMDEMGLGTVKVPPSTGKRIMKEIEEAQDQRVQPRREREV